MKSEWAKVTLTDKRVLHGLCSDASCFGLTMVQVEVPFAQRQTRQRIVLNVDVAALDKMSFSALTEILEQAGEIVYADTPTFILAEKIARIANEPPVERFASAECFPIASIFSYQVVSEEEVRKALKQWTKVERTTATAPKHNRCDLYKTNDCNCAAPAGRMSSPEAWTTREMLDNAEKANSIIAALERLRKRVPLMPGRKLNDDLEWMFTASEVIAEINLAIEQARQPCPDTAESESLAHESGLPCDINADETTRETVDEAVARNGQRLTSDHERVLQAMYAREFGESGEHLTGTDILNVFAAGMGCLERNDNIDVMREKVNEALTSNGTLRVICRGTAILKNGDVVHLDDGKMLVVDSPPDTIDTAE